MRAIVGLLVNQPIERGLRADDAIDQFLAESAIRLREFRGGEGGIEEIFDKIAAFALQQNL